MKSCFLTLSLACALVLTCQLSGCQSLATYNPCAPDPYYGQGGLFVRALPTCQPYSNVATYTGKYSPTMPAKADGVGPVYSASGSLRIRLPKSRQEGYLCARFSMEKPKPTPTSTPWF